MTIYVLVTQRRASQERQEDLLKDEDAETSAEMLTGQVSPIHLN